MTNQANQAHTPPHGIVLELMLQKYRPATYLALLIVSVAILISALVSIRGVHAWLSLAFFGLICSLAALIATNLDPLLKSWSPTKKLGWMTFVLGSGLWWISGQAAGTTFVSSSLSLSALLMAMLFAVVISRPEFLSAKDSVALDKTDPSHDSVRDAFAALKEEHQAISQQSSEVGISSESLQFESSLDLQSTVINTNAFSAFDLNLALSEDEIEADFADDSEFEFEDGCGEAQPMQSWVRLRDHLTDQIQGTVQAEFQAGQKQISLHLPFWPAFDCIPEGDCEAADAEFSAEFDLLKSYGGRIIVRRQSPALFHQLVPIEVSITAERAVLKAA